MNQSWSGMNVKELTHSQQQPQAPRTHKKKPTIRQAIRTVFCAPQRSLPFKDDVFLAFKATNSKFFVPGCTGRLWQMGLNVVTIKHWLFVLQQPILIDGIKMLHLTYCYVSKIIF